MSLIHLSARLLGWFLVLLLLGVPLTAWAQTSPEGDERTYGTASDVVHALPAPAFIPTTQSDGPVFHSSSFAWSCVSALCDFLAPVILPAGAVITRLELDACIGDRVTVVFYRTKKSQAPGLSTALANYSTANFDVVPPACTLFSSGLFAPEIVDNFNNTYVLQVLVAGAVLNDTRFSSVRVFYRLQTSPAPAVATFNDVPTTHPFFPFIEALVAAGITTGCNTAPPLFCPDGPVTRKQMAAFIAKALGLHWAP